MANRFNIKPPRPEATVETAPALVHVAELGEQEQAGLFAELNETCGFDYAAEVVTLAKKRSAESAGKSVGGDSGAPD